MNEDMTLTEFAERMDCFEKRIKRAAAQPLTLAVVKQIKAIGKERTTFCQHYPLTAARYRENQDKDQV